MIVFEWQNLLMVATTTCHRTTFGSCLSWGVEPTNNHSEQQVRHCVIDRRITQGTRSESGQRYHERMWTALATCDKQGRSFFQFLHASLTAKLTGMTPPTLLPR